MPVQWILRPVCQSLDLSLSGWAGSGGNGLAAGFVDEVSAIKGPCREAPHIYFIYRFLSLNKIRGKGKDWWGK